MVQSLTTAQSAHCKMSSQAIDGHMPISTSSKQSIAVHSEIENVEIANALQLEAVLRRAVPMAQSQVVSKLEFEFRTKCGAVGNLGFDGR